MSRDGSRQDPAVRITTAATSRNDDIAGRQRRYLLSMGLRSLCFVGAVFAAMAGLTWLWPILIVAALVLPYVAVVMANAAHTRNDDFALLGQAAEHPELESGTSTPQDRSTRG